MDALFHPSHEEMYPYSQKNVFVDNESPMTMGLCGAKRPGHFRGVMTVVMKLFMAIKPNKSYFGQKDAQQVAVIGRMIDDLFLDVEVVPCPIVRESDGLALSSRNVFLTEEERREATALHRALLLAREAIDEGEKSPDKIKKIITNKLESTSGQIDYIEIVSQRDLASLTIIEGDVLIAIAVKFSAARLIDNIFLEVSPCL